MILLLKMLEEITSYEFSNKENVFDIYFCKTYYVLMLFY
jgi:hypothetical protein